MTIFLLIKIFSMKFLYHRHHRLILGLLITCFALIVFNLELSYANSEDAQRIATTISNDFMSPFCPGRTLSACPSSEAVELKENIQLLAKQGQSEEEIRKYLSTWYGDEFQGTPKLSGFGIVGYALPLCFLIFGGVLIYRFVVLSIRRDAGK